MRRITYLVWGDAWSPVIRGQACDVVGMLRGLDGVASADFAMGVSLRHFLKERRSILTADADASVLPMFPGNRNWSKNVPLLALYLSRKRSNVVICRGPIAAVLALRARKFGGLDCRVCYDGRGARSAEIREYSSDDVFADVMSEIEREAIQAADWRIAVSQALVEHWRESFDFNGNDYTVVPCSVAAHFDGPKIKQGQLIRESFGWGKDDPIIVHLGGGAGWQNGPLSFVAIRHWLRVNPRLRHLILSKENDQLNELKTEFPDQVVITQVTHDQVPDYLSAADYGLLLREENVTNGVASPVKFAEYLSCGLQILISANLGDFSEMVAEDSLGNVVTELNYADVSFVPVSECRKRELSEYAMRVFSKASPFVRQQYQSVLNGLRAYEDR
mgnify:CR=1 FL=1